MVMRMSDVVGWHVRVRRTVHASGTGSWTGNSSHMTVTHVRTCIAVWSTHHMRIWSATHMRWQSSRTTMHSGAGSTWATHHVGGRRSTRMMVWVRMWVIHHLGMRGMRRQHLVHSYAGPRTRTGTGTLTRWSTHMLLLLMYRNCVRIHHGSVIIVTTIIGTIRTHGTRRRLKWAGSGIGHSWTGAGTIQRMVR